MKRLVPVFAILSILLVVESICYPFQPVFVDARFEQLEPQLEVQLERVRYAQEQADAAMNLTRMSAAERLRTSEGLLKRERAALERLKDQLREQNAEASTVRTPGDKDWNRLLAEAFVGVEAKIREIGTLMDRLETFRGDVDVDDDYCSQRRRLSQSNQQAPGTQQQSLLALSPEPPAGPGPAPQVPPPQPMPPLPCPGRFR